MTRATSSIPARLSIFAAWWDDEDGWFTPAQLAEIIECAEGSIPSAFTWLRRHGFVVSVRRVWTKQVNLYNIQRCKSWALDRQVDRSQANLVETKQKFARRLARV
jgi:hypothetical protein